MDLDRNLACALFCATKMSKWIQILVQLQSQNNLIFQQDRAELASNTHEDNHITSHGKRHCAFRLLNVLFSDKFVEDFASLGVVIGKDDLTDKWRNNEPSWTRVEEAFIELQFTDDMHFK